MIFFHGLGACGQDMKDYVGAALARRCPHLSMRFPDAPMARNGGDGRSWFYAEDMLADPDSNVSAQRALEGIDDVNEYIDSVLIQEKIAPERLVIAGFSQGATTAFFSALKRDKPVGGVCSISGGALDQLKTFNCCPPVKLLAGANEHNSYSGLYSVEKAEALLRDAGFEVDVLLTPDNDHDLDWRSLEELANFIHDRIPEITAPPVRTHLAGRTRRPSDKFTP